MHTVIMIASGLAVLALFALAAAVLGKSMAVGARWFVLPWLLVSLINLYVGTTHGHSVAGELPFLAIVFGAPALAAYALMRWKAGSTAAG